VVGFAWKTLFRGAVVGFAWKTLFRGAVVGFAWKTLFHGVVFSNDHQRRYLAYITPFDFLTISGELISVIWCENRSILCVFAEISSLVIVRISDSSKSCK
jgi:hypothetical protein